MFDNILLNTDSYKASHFLQYPPGTQRVFSYIEARGGDYDYTTFFGLQAFLKQYLEGVQVTTEKIDEAEAVWNAHGEPFDRSRWEYIRLQHGGRLPVVIRAVPEGTNVPVLNALVTIENTDPECFWLTSFLETALLRAVWYPTTVATISNSVRRMILDFLIETCDNPLAEIDFKLHDFGARGVSSNESAALGGMAHLVNFLGSDTIVGVLAARKYYGCEMAGFSIPAAEHSTITAWGKENEIEAYRNMLKQFAKPGSLVAVVSDSYDIYNACTNLWGDKLKREVLESGATVVVRPDSGNPVVVATECVRLLYEKYGGSVNSKGYKVLAPQIRVIQGDGVNPDSIRQILESLKLARFSAENIAFGMGGGLLQKLDRDTQKWAMKCSAIERNGKWVDVFKDPVTDKGKISKKGKLSLVKTTDGFKTVREPVSFFDTRVLDIVFKNGRLLKEHSFDDIRMRAKGLNPTRIGAA